MSPFKRFAPVVCAPLLLTLAACGATQDPASAEQAQNAVVPTPTAPALPAVDVETEKVSEAVVTAVDLGSPWVQPEKVNKVESVEGETCPGQPSSRVLAKARARSTAAELTQGEQAGAPIGTFRVRTYAPGEEGLWRDAFAKVAAGCAEWKAAEGNFVTIEVVKAPAVPGADEVLTHIERVYADEAHTQLQFVRHYWEARTGRAVSTLEYAYVMPSTDPTGADLGASADLVAKQVAKTRSALGL